MQLETDPSMWDQPQNGTLLTLPGLSILKEETLSDLCAEDGDAMMNQLNDLSRIDKTYFAFLPTCETIAWHIKREDLNASLIHGHWKTRYRGVISESRRAWLIWHFDEIECKLKVQRIVTLDRDERKRNTQELAALLRFAQWTAKGSGITSVLIWNPDEETVAAAELLRSHYDRMRVSIAERSGSLACARRRDDVWQDDLCWVANEFYAWC